MTNTELRRKMQDEVRKWMGHAYGDSIVQRIAEAFVEVAIDYGEDIAIEVASDFEEQWQFRDS